MWKAIVNGIRLPDKFGSTYAARVASIEAYTEALSASAAGAVRVARLRGKQIPWPEIEKVTVIEPIQGEWVVLEGQDYYPEDCDEQGSLVFIDRKKGIRRFGCFADGFFIEESSEKHFPLDRVLSYYIIPE